MGVYVGDSLVAGNVGEVYTKAQVDTMIANAVALAEPVGSIKPFAGTTVPDGYLLCDGSAISRTTYAALFAVIGTTYGTGDGSTTFNLPKLNTGDPALGAEIAYIGQKTDGSLPNITGSTDKINAYTHFNTTQSGSLYNTEETVAGRTSAGQGGGGLTTIRFDASRSSSIYTNGQTRVKSAGVYVMYCIKY